MKIVLTGGGTAGHISGNMALVPELKKHGYEIHYIGTKRGMENGIVASDKDITYHAISAGRLQRSFTKENIHDAFEVIKGLKESHALLKEIKPDIVFSKGGFVTVPVVIAADQLHIPAIIHESDLSLGLANKISARHADVICTTFPETADTYKSSKTVCTGSPLRQELFEGSRETGLKICDFSGNKPVITVMGGSLGAAPVNDLVRSALPELTEKYDIIHICGKIGVDENYSGIKGYRQFGFVTSELCHLFAATDIAISRAGSNSIFEFLAAKKPMLLIPLPKASGSRGDQILNADSFEKNGFAIKAEQEGLDKDTFCRKINELYRRKDEFIKTMASSDLINGNKNILELIYKHTKRQ